MGEGTGRAKVRELIEIKKV